MCKKIILLGFLLRRVGVAVEQWTNKFRLRRNWIQSLSDIRKPDSISSDSKFICSLFNGAPTRSRNKPQQKMNAEILQFLSDHYVYELVQAYNPDFIFKINKHGYYLII